MADNADIAWAVKELGKNADYHKYHQYLTGKQPLAYATEKFRSAFGGLFATFAYNRCAMVVDAHSDRLQVTGFGANKDATATAAQTLWDDNQMDVREGQVSAESFTTGDSYVIVEVHPDTGAVQIWPQLAAHCRVRYSDTEPGKVILGTKSWRDDDKKLRLNLYYPDRIEKYAATTASEGSTLSPNTLQEYKPPEDSAWPVPLNINDTVPVFHFANNGRVNSCGISELRDVLPLQDAINKTLMDMLVTMEFAAFPQRVLINIDADDDDTAESIRKFQAGIDRLLTLIGSSDGKPPSIAEFSAANIEQYTKVVELFDTMISRVSKVPVHYLSMSSDFPSGRALRLAEAPFVAKIEDRQRARGAVWSEVARYGLRLQGMDVQPGKIRVNWQPAAPLSEEDKWDLVIQKTSAGMPLVAAMREAGYDPDQIKAIQEEIAQEQEKALKQFNAGGVRPGFGEDEEEEGRAG